MQIDTRYTPLQLTNSAFVTSPATSPTEPVPTTIAPTGDGVLEMGWSKGGITPGAMLANALKLLPIGSGADDTTFLMNVYAWELTISGPNNYGLWVPTILATFTCTLGTTVPVTNTDVPTTAASATVRFCDTIVLGVGNANVSVEVLSDTSNRVGHIILDAKGAALIEVRFGLNSSASSCNCLAKKL